MSTQIWGMKFLSLKLPIGGIQSPRVAFTPLPCDPCDPAPLLLHLLEVSQQLQESGWEQEVSAPGLEVSILLGAFR